MLSILRSLRAGRSQSEVVCISLGGGAARFVLGILVLLVLILSRGQAHP